MCDPSSATSRMAIGAERKSVLLLFMAEGFKLALIGVVPGLVGAFAAAQLVTGLLHGVTPADPAVYAATAVLTVAIALVAPYVPARTATRVDPIVALRHE